MKDIDEQVFNNVFFTKKSIAIPALPSKPVANVAEYVDNELIEDESQDVLEEIKDDEKQSESEEKDEEESESEEEDVEGNLELEKEFAESEENSDSDKSSDEDECPQLVRPKLLLRSWCYVIHCTGPKESNTTYIRICTW